MRPPMRPTTRPILFATAMALSLLACHQDQPAAKSGAESPELAAVAAVMKHYETCHGKLADDSADVADCAAAIAREAASHEGAPMKRVAEAAEALEATSPDDIEKVRMAFGELSREVVGLLGSVPGAAARYHVFECSMATGYKRWAQSEKTLKNPYMGAKMSECGSEVTPEG